MQCEPKYNHKSYLFQNIYLSFFFIKKITSLKKEKEKNFSLSRWYIKPKASLVFNKKIF